MSKPFEKKAPPLSYAEGPRLQRALESLEYNDQVRFVESYRAHLQGGRFKSLQRRDRYVYVAVRDGESECLEVFDLGAPARAQSFLAALTDCLRTQSAAVKVLTPTAAPAES